MNNSESRISEHEDSAEDGEIVESSGNAKRRKIDTVEMVDTADEIAGYLQKLRILLDQIDTPREVLFKTQMSGRYQDVLVKAKLSAVLDLKERPIANTVRRQTNQDELESEVQISIVSWALMQRDVYNIMTQVLSETHRHHLNGIQQGGA